MNRLVARTLFALVLLAAVTMVVQTGSVPHLHLAGQVGFFNAEHDLTLLAGLAAHSLPAETPPLIVETLSAAVFTPAPDHPAVRLVHSGESRAPPTA